MTDPEGSDEAVVSAVLGGEREAFAGIVRKYQNRVFSLGLRFFRNRNDAEDYAQEVFVRVFERLGTFRGESRFGTWLMKVAYYHGISSFRARRVFDSLPEEAEIPAVGDGPEKLHARRAAREALAAALRELPDRYRVCLDLYFSFGMTYQDVAAVTDVPVNTVKSHVFRAKNILRSSLRNTAAEAYDDL